MTHKIIIQNKASKHLHVQHVLGKSFSLVVIAKQNVNIGYGFEKLVLKELTDERRRQIESERAIVLEGKLGHTLNRLRTDREKESL